MGKKDGSRFSGAIVAAAGAAKHGMIVAACFAMFLCSCTATPKLHLKSVDMSMELNQSAPVVSSVAFSPDGKYGLASSVLGNATLWDMSSATAAKKFVAQGRNLKLSVAFSPDGLHGVTGGKELKLWDLSTGGEVSTIGDEGIAAMAISPDNKSVLTVGKTDPFMVLWDMKTGSVIKKFRLDDFLTQTPAISVTLSRDGRYALTGDRKGRMILWDVAAGTKIGSVRADNGHNFLPGSAVQSVAFSPDGKYASSGGMDGTVRLWNTRPLSLAKELNGHTGMGGIGAVAFSSDGRSVLSGGLSDGLIKIWDISTGAEAKSMKSHSGVRGVSSLAISPDGKFILSGGDASTRIWDFATGEEVATMVSFEDGEWVVVTASGYYNSSEKGDQYMMVTVGGKPYTISQLRESFYRPDMVKLALSGGSLKNFAKLADIKQPPVVSIVNTPASVDRDEASVTLRIADSGGGIGDIRLYLNGAAVMLDSSRGVKVAPTNQNEVTKTYHLKLTKGLNSIRAVAFNGDNTMQSADAIHQIIASFQTDAKPSLYALVIGINDYKNPRLQLNNAVADASLFGTTLKQSASGLFDKVNVKMLTTAEATTNENIIKELKTMRSINPDDLFVFYVASHGTVDDGEYFLITSNVGSTRTERLKTDAVSQTVFKELIANIPATKKLIIIDTCNAGALGGAIQTAMLTRGMSEDTAMKVLSRAVGSTVLSASTSIQEALEGYNGHGLFTYVLTEGLQGKADKGRTGYVRTTELADYVDTEVPVLAEKIFKKAQYPTISISGQAFPIVKVK